MWLCLFSLSLLGRGLTHPNSSCPSNLGLQYLSKKSFYSLYADVGLFAYNVNGPPSKIGVFAFSKYIATWFYIKL